MLARNYLKLKIIFLDYIFILTLCTQEVTFAHHTRFSAEIQCRMLIVYIFLSTDKLFIILVFVVHRNSEFSYYKYDIKYIHTGIYIHQCLELYPTERVLNAKS